MTGAQALLYPGHHAESHGPSLRSSSSSAVPLGFKAAKRRKTPQFIRECQALRTPQQVVRQPSVIPPELMEDPDVDKLTAGVARLIYRLIMEGQTSRVAEDLVAPVPSEALPSGSFDREVFFQSPRRSVRARVREWCSRCCSRSTEEELPAPIFRLLRDCIAAGHFSSDLAVICAVYIERFTSLTRLRLTKQNWQPILLAALLLASKVFEDIHPWNADYAAILWRAAGMRIRERLSLYRLEAQFLRGLRWRASISGEVFAAYYFSLKEADAPPSPSHRHEYNLQYSGDHRLVRRCASWCGSPGSFGFNRMSEVQESTEEPGEEGPYPSRCHSGTSSSGNSCASPGRQDPMVASFVPPVSPGSEPRPRRDILSMEDLPWTDARNPLIGAFRHAPHADPPSRHINPRLPRVQSEGAGWPGLPRVQSLGNCHWPPETGGVPGELPKMARAASAEGLSWSRSVSA